MTDANVVVVGFVGLGIMDRERAKQPAKRVTSPYAWR
jgi:hypothetical protein